MTRRQLAGLLITIVGLASIAVATLTPVSGNSEHSPWWCVTCGSIAMADAIVNVALFIPAGVGLALISRRTIGSIVLLALASVAVEISQALVVAGRDTALRDVLANTAGAVVGVEIVRQWRQWLVPAPTRAARLALAAAVAWAVTLGATLMLLRASTPPEGYWGQRGTAPEFSGHVVHVAVNSAVVPLGSFLDPRPVLAALNSDDARVEVVFVPGVPTGESEPIARVSNPQTEAFRLSQRGHDLLFSVRTRSSDIGLRSPIVRLAGAIVASADGDGPAADTVAVLGRLHRGILSLDRHGERPSHVALRITPTTGWVYFAPTAITTRVASWIIDGLWVAALLCPVGYWGAAALSGGRGQQPRERGRWLLPTIGLAIVLPLALVARVSGAPPAAWTTWCFAVAGLLIGVLALRLVRDAVRNPG